MKSNSSFDEAAFSPAQLAQARSHSYALLGRLFLEGVTADLLPYLQIIPELAAVLPGPFDAEEAAAIHHDLFAFHLFPYASIFLDDSGLLGGTETNRTAQVYQEAGFLIEVSTTGPDHLGYELAFLAFLLAAKEEPSHLLQHRFLEDYLLPWLAPCVVAIEQAGNPFYQALAYLTLALTTNHYVELATMIAPQRELLPLFPQTVDILDDTHTGLREIANYLLTPCQSGFYLGRHDIRRLARQLQISHGFGGREQMLLNLLRTAAQYECSQLLLQLITEYGEQWQLAYERIRGDFSETARFVRPWQYRLQHSQHLLQQMMAHLPTE